jgi:hypothetical protein
MSPSSLMIAKTLLNVDSSGVATHGYDLVAFFADDHPVKGNQENQSVFNGAEYCFASAEHNEAFDCEDGRGRRSSIEMAFRRLGSD